MALQVWVVQRQASFHEGEALIGVAGGLGSAVDLAHEDAHQQAEAANIAADRLILWREDDERLDGAPLAHIRLHAEVATGDLTWKRVYSCQRLPVHQRKHAGDPAIAPRRGAA